MRVRFNSNTIVECYNVDAEKSGLPDDNNPGHYSEMHCFLTMQSIDWPSYRDDDYNEECDLNLIGKFDCSGATTFEEVDEIIKPFFDDLFINGYIDLSTNEMLKKYKLTLY